MKSALCLLGVISCMAMHAQTGSFTISKTKLKDKIKGGWAGQTIGVTFGGPLEFKYNGTIVNEYQPITWYPGYVKDVMTNNPGLYDDLYMDLTFVEVMEREGIDAPASSHAKAYAHAGYPLWHANQAARYNILQGMAPPASGHWKNNPHADCIDYQIEADFAGLMAPGMPHVSSQLSDKIGHIMNYGDGYYGGVFVAACYTLAFRYDDVATVVKEAIKTIPKESNYYKCISDVIRWHDTYPGDWKKTWFEVQNKWSQDYGCPDGVFNPFNIDATINSAYVVIGLLYGQKDFTQTMEITTRCGQDADCNPSTAGGILGTLLGYSMIPVYWREGLKGAEDMDFKHTSTSINEVTEISFKHALTLIEKNKGKINKDQVSIPISPVRAVPLEKSFSELFPVDRINVYKNLEPSYSFEFEGTGFVIKGETAKWDAESQQVHEVEVLVDGTYERIKLPTDFKSRRHEIHWNYTLAPGPHKVQLRLLNPAEGHDCRLTQVIIYNNKPSADTYKNIYQFGQQKLKPKVRQ